MNTFSRILLCGFACILGLIPFSLQATATTLKKHPTLDHIVASVNNEAITASELNKQTELLLARLRQTDTPSPALPHLRKQVLEKMVIEKLQLQLAAEENIVIDETTLDKTIEEIAARDSLSVSQMKGFLEEQGIPFTQFRRTIKTELTLSKLHQKEIGQHIIVSKRDIENFLKSPAGQDQTGAEYHLGHILIPLPETSDSHEQQKFEVRAENIVKELKAGADFSKIAIAKSSGQQALEGGDLGWRNSASMPSLFTKVVPVLRVGEIHGPIRDSSGFHIIKLLGKRLPNAPKDLKASSEAMNNKAMELLYQRKMDEQLVSWLRRMRADAEVKIYLPVE